MGLEAYWIPIRTALVLFPFLALLMLLPWLIYTYRKYGFLSTWMSTVVYSFIFYGLCMFFLVILPLPNTRNNSAGHTADTVYQVLVPFTFVKDILKNDAIVLTSIKTYVHIFKDRAFLQALFNFMLFLPLGIYLRYFGVKLRKVILIGFLISLFFEITQRTGIYGIYQFPYRLFDVDDLILNTFGTFAGFGIAPFVLWLFPSTRDVEVKSLKIKEEPQVRPVARLLALFVDLTLIGLLRVFHSEWFILAGYGVIFVGMPYLLKGATPGTALMHFRLYSEKKMGILIRAAALYITHFIYLGFDWIWNLPLNDMDPLFIYQLGLRLAIVAVSFAFSLTIFIHVLRVLVRKRIDYFYFDRLGKVHCKRSESASDAV